MDKYKKYFAEALGTLVLTFMGCGAAVLHSNPNIETSTVTFTLTVAFVFGLAVVAMAYAIGGISGCHINPAISLAMFIRKRISGKDFAAYVVSQIIGAIAGIAILCAIVATSSTLKAGAYGSNGTGTIGIGGSLITEVVLTFIFVLTVLRVTADESKSANAGLIVGLTLVLVHLVGIPLTGTSVNPARSIAPAIFAGGDSLKEVWIFIVAPLAGAALAAVADQYFFVKEKTELRKAKKKK